MAISSPGISTGLDVSSIVSQLVALERKPLERLEAQESKLQTKLSAFGRMQSAMSAFQDAARALNEPKTWKAATASSADDKTATVAASGSPTPGGYTLQVQQLAQRQTAASAVFPGSTATPGAGTLHIQLGSVSGSGAFTPDGARAAVDVVVSATDTLEQVRDKINGAAGGVSASIVKDGSGARLALRSTETGASQAFQVAAADADGDATDAAGLSALAVDPSTGATSPMQLTLAARDAQFTIDGLAMTSATNKIEGAIEGLTVELRKAGGGPVDLQVATDQAALKTAITRFTDTYNALNTLISDQTRYDAATKTAGALQGNATAVGIQSRLRTVLREQMSTAGTPAPGAATPYSRLSDIGITIQRNGSLAIDATKLDGALADPSRVRQLFAAADETDASRNGFAQRFHKLTSGLLGSDGAITTANESMQRIQKDLDSRQAEMERRLEITRTRLLKQYTDLDTKLGAVQSIDFSRVGLY